MSASGSGGPIDVDTAVEVGAWLCADAVVLGSLLGLSPVVRQAGRWTPLFSRSLCAGLHQVQVVHGYVRGDTRDGRMDLQPQSFEVEIEAGSWRRGLGLGLRLHWHSTIVRVDWGRAGGRTGLYITFGQVF